MDEDAKMAPQMQAQRLKTFAECDQPEQIRRLRQEVEHLRTLFHRQSDQLAMLKHHTHADGKVVIEVSHAEHCTARAEGSYNNLR